MYTKRIITDREAQISVFVVLLDIGVESCMVEMTVCFLRVTITYVNKYNTIQYTKHTANICCIL